MVTSRVTFKIKGITYPGEVFAVCGNSTALGSWSFQKAVFLEPNANDNITWTATVDLPRATLFQYRYFKCYAIEPKNPADLRQVLVNKWETHPHPRSFNPSEVECILDDGYFGIHNGIEKLDSGWLTCQSEIRLRLHYSEKPPVSISKKKFKKSRFRVKLTLEGFEEEDEDDDKLVTPLAEKIAPTLEIALISNNEYKSRHSQPECGYALETGQWTEYSIQTMEPDNLELIFDFFEEELGVAVVQGDALPGHVGSACLLSSTIVEKSSGVITLPIMSRNSRQTIGKVKVDYIVIKPLEGFTCDMSPSLSKYWKPRMALDVGHRGAGNSTSANLAKVRENTIASFKNAASHGAAFVEFDVHLSKDHVPIVYHDLTCCISMKKKMDKESSELFEIPVKELTFEQLQLLKLAHVAALKVTGDKENLDDENDVSENQPFPSLQQVLLCVPENIGFNIEIKWPCQQKDGTWEGNLPTYLDMNKAIDVILKCTLENASNRHIVFSSFVPDVCSMIRQKQNKYPVLFLTQGYTDAYPELMDLRCRTTPIAMSFAQSENLLGVNVHTEDLLRNPGYIQQAKSKGLVIFCWGDDTNESENRRILKQKGIDGLIYDRICDFLLGQTNIFQVEELDELKQQLPEEAFVDCSCPDINHFTCQSIPGHDDNGSAYSSEIKSGEQEMYSTESDSGHSCSSF
ncbi:glycerophosphocholine phosphodiesterase GPCPD1 [Pristis pectinata]|uniref:glycerophosphocholine phosphodiesterase GPCPD1 n=1 Tax=Pristis pectinata TaxID=685728 RepID=UPI00223CF4A6|nr:glycerophosphocholine phosphodiesterase GPCPD1 [Pristis pectinata]XP_051867704.1 glycerophosphocholine phosphodiesterase GPCPD1 [Pristis pectinata]XP_051867705.1 glycerophosphocholine phosphodiesterase GPCPD1 [Pristis pectinata]XP_051867707.1 glycerophosphocholine phosphodiesterase GPCPD1 [Pristis pectinata]